MPLFSSYHAVTRWAVCCLWLILGMPTVAPAQEPITLQRAIAMALGQGHQARAAEATRDAARFRDQAFYSRQLPQLSLGGTVPSLNRSIIQVVQPDGSTLFQPQNQTSASLTATVTQQLPFSGGSFFISSALSRLSISGTQSFQTWQSTPVSFGLRQPIHRPNALGWDRREQPVRVDVAERAYRESREDIALATAGLFFDVYAAQVAFNNATTNAAVNDTLYRLNSGRFEVGRIGENDLLQSELALLRARTQLDGARLDYQRTLAALRLGLNLAIESPLAIAVSLDVPTFDPDTLLAVTQALRNRSSVADAELQSVQANRRVTEAKLNNGIGATVTASYGFNATAPERRRVYSNLLEAQQFALAVDIPIWGWGNRQEATHAAEADRERVVNLNANTLEQVRQDAHFAALGLSQARRNLGLVAKADTVAQKRFEVAYNRYVIGRIAIDNLFIAQNEKDQSVTQFVLALRGYWQAHYRLRRATLYDFERGEPLR